MHTTLTPEECDALLQSTHYGHLGCVDGDNPYVFPVTYLYKDGSLFGYTREGTKVQIMRKHPQVCVQVEQVKSGFEWESVMCHGLFSEITDPTERHDIELLLADQYAVISLQEKMVPVSPAIGDLHLENVEAVQKSVLYRIDITEKTGVREVPRS